MEESHFFTYETQANQDRTLLESEGILQFGTLTPGHLILRSCGVPSARQSGELS